MFTEVIADFVARSATAPLPEPVLRAARRGLLDCLAVMLAGGSEPVCRILSDRVRASPGAAEATVVGGLRASAPLAAWVNGAAAHALDYDDVLHIGSYWMGHPSVVVLPAALAAAEYRDASGLDLLRAYVIGIEVYAAVGLLCGDEPYRRGWHNTSYVGTMAAAAAAAAVLGLDAPGVRRAFGIAGSLAGGLRQNFGTMTKPLHAGIAARSGVEAVLLSAAGLTADMSIFEAPLGFRNVFNAAYSDFAAGIPQGDALLTPEAFARSLGYPWRIVEPGLIFKVCPSCRATHFGMDAALEFRRTPGFDPQRLRAIDCHVPEHMSSVLFHHAPVKGLEAKFSMEYVVARTLLDGAPGVSDFTDERLAEPAVRKLMSLVRWLPFDPAPGTFGTPQFEFVLADGRRYRVAIESPAGEAGNPLSDQLLQAKFTDCARLTLPDGQALQLRACVDALEHAQHVSEVTRLLV